MDINKFFSLIFNHAVPKNRILRIKSSRLRLERMERHMSGFGLRTVYLAQ